MSHREILSQILNYLSESLIQRTMEQKESLKRTIDLLEPHLALQNNDELESIVVMICGVSGQSSDLGTPLDKEY